MKLTLAGLVFIALGVVFRMFRGIPYRTTEKVIDVGPFHATAQQDKTIEIPPPVGAGIVAAGTVLLLIGARRRGSK